ncbi:MAG: GNAT family N-acetyltransferase [Caldilineaceae bacterium]
MSTMSLCPEQTAGKQDLSEQSRNNNQIDTQSALANQPSFYAELAQMTSAAASGTDRWPNGGLTYRVYGPDADQSGFDALESEWNALLQRSVFNNFFLTHEWQTTWWEYLGVGELWIVAFRSPDTNELVGIAPLYRTVTQTDAANGAPGKARLTLVGCIDVSDYLDLIIKRGWEAQVYATLCNWLYSAAAPAWNILDLCNLPEESQTYRQFPALAQQAGCQVQVVQEDVAPQFVLPLRYEDYLQNQVDKKQRHEIRRKQRRAERESNMEFYVIGQPQPGRSAANGQKWDLEAEMNDFIRLQRASRDDKADFMTPHMRTFFTNMAQRMLDAGRLRLCFLKMDGQKAATLFAFEYDNRFLLYNSGYDPDIFAHLSPGWVLLAYTIQYAIAAGNKLFDFMQGDEEYKFRFGSSEYKVMRVIVER